jgi:hypothetical protein
MFIKVFHEGIATECGNFWESNHDEVEIMDLLALIQFTEKYAIELENYGVKD